MMPPKPFLIAAVVAWGGLSVAILSGARERSSATAPVVSKFDARWQDVRNEAPLLKKQDRLPLPVMQPIRVVPETVMMVARDVTPEQTDEPKRSKPKHERHAQAERDVCTRHGMHKVSEKRHGWRSWRCRR